ncbi:hypothetical protein [Lentzea sp. HUAS12]|uniref:hypothetical protein n=1 Tax=Lentzea sp. HUAS12 TaxID=2951806 RepID=UPI00209E305C|nr:hypothetical protein [Lentzea sp. HUAS12]USX54122.1 hypothetical protein ND450_08485 [Lentzea sp. HUAS12]
MSEMWNVPTFVVSAIFGAISGGLTSLLIGARKAEREERGKRRIEARMKLGKAIRIYRHDYKKIRLLRLENQEVEVDALFASALELAISTNACSQLLSYSERVILRRRVASVIGFEMLVLADLQVEDADEVSTAALHMVAERCRVDPKETMRLLIEVEPTASVWDDILRRIERLARKYS